jgi:hypothetical protein
MGGRIHVARMGDMRDAYKILVGSLKEEATLRTYS